MQVFISYSSIDKKLAKLLSDDLRKIDVGVWIDESEILVGHDITDKVYEGLMASDYIAIILTSNSVKSQWVKEELNFAKTKSITCNGKRTILPLLFESCVIPPSISTIKFSDFRESYNYGFESLAKSLGICLTSVKQNPLRDHFWGKVSGLINISVDGYLSENLLLTLKDQVEKEYAYSHKALYYTGKNYVNINYEEDVDSCLFGGVVDGAKVFIADYASHIIWRSLYGLIKNINGEKKINKKDLLNSFNQSLLARLAVPYYGPKNESQILAEIKMAVSLIRGETE